MIRVKTQEKDIKKEVPYADGTTVETALKAAGVKKYGRGYTVTVNGEKAGLGDKVPDGAEVVVTQNADNG